MKKILIAIVCAGAFSAHAVVGPATGGSGTPGGSSGQIQYNNSGSFAGIPAMNGDCTLNLSTGVIACTKVAGNTLPTIGTLTTGGLIYSTGSSALASTAALSGYLKGNGALAPSAAATVPLSDMAAQAANSVVGNATSGSAAPTAMTMPSCSGATDALKWTSGTGFGCNTISGGSMTYPGAGVAVSTGSAWGTSYGSANLIPSSVGGTGNGFTKFAGPTSTEKTITLPDANATMARSDAANTFTGTQTFSTPIAVSSGGTGGSTALAASRGVKAKQSIQKSFVAVADYGNDTAIHTMVTVTIPALTANDVVECKFRITQTSSTNAKTWTAVLGGTGGTAFFSRTFNSTTAAVMDVVFGNRNATNSQLGYAYHSSGNGNATMDAGATATIETNAGTTLLLRVTKTTGTESVSVEGYDCWLSSDGT